MDFEIIWDRIEKCAGETFSTVRGKILLIGLLEILLFRNTRDFLFPKTSF